MMEAATLRPRTHTMEALAHVNVVLAAFGGVMLMKSAELLSFYISFKENDGRSFWSEDLVLTAAPCGFGAALLVLALLAARAAHATRAPRHAIYIIYACAMAAVIACESAQIAWMEHRGHFASLKLDADLSPWMWASLVLLALLALLELAALALAALLASRAARPRRLTSQTAWKPICY